MTEHKYTDEEVIKALECCAVDPKSGKFSDCKNCPLDAIKDANCFNWIIQQCALDLINRQKAEISALTSAVDNSTQEFLKLHDKYKEQKAEIAFWMDAAANAKKEAVKEFAEKLKEYAEWYSDDNCSFDYIPLEDIDNAVKKFTEEKT